MTGNRIVHRFEPRGAARELFSRKDDEVLLSGPAGTGKSRAALEKLHMMMLINPGARGLIVRKTMASLGSTGLVTYREHVAPEAIRNGTVTWFGGSQQEAACYKYSNGSTLVVGGMDKATKIMSSEYDVVYVQEAIELTENDWEAITTRLRNGKISFQQIIADTNPDTPHHWLKMRCDAGKTVLLESRHEDNPTLYAPDGSQTAIGAAYISKLDSLTGVRFARLRKGLWVAAEGMVYEDYDPLIHLVDRFDPPADWERWWAVDFGFTNPFVWQEWVEDPDGRLYLFREIYKTQKTVDEHAKEIQKITMNTPAPTAVICDHDAEGRRVFEKILGVSTTPAHKKKTEGIQAVQQRLIAAKDGRPRMYFMRDSRVGRPDTILADAKKPTSTVEEIVGYVWDIKPDKPPKEDPVKEDDHGMDAMRYMVAQRDLKNRPNLRWM